MVGPPSSWSRDQEESREPYFGNRLELASHLLACNSRGSRRRAVAFRVRRSRQGEFARALITRRRDMFIKAGFVLLVVWLLGILGVYRGGTLVHVLLLVGLMLLLLGFLKARDTAADGEAQSGSGHDQKRR